MIKVKNIRIIEGDYIKMIRKRGMFFVASGVLLLCLFLNATMVSASSYNTSVSSTKSKNVCTHPEYIRYGKGTFVKVSIKNDSTNCYKTSYRYKQRCKKCLYKFSEPSYDAWTYHKHNYGFLNLKKRCKECGHKK